MLMATSNHLGVLIDIHMYCTVLGMKGLFHLEATWTTYVQSDEIIAKGWTVKRDGFCILMV